MKKIKMIASLGISAIGILVACLGCQMLGKESDNRSIAPDGERLNRIPGTESIEIPPGVSDKQALDVIEATIKGTKAGDRKNYWVSQWRMEARDANNKWIRIGLTARQHYLCVCYRIEGGKLVPDVPTSTNLKQDGIKIHRKVPVWINNLKPLIRAGFLPVLWRTVRSFVPSPLRNSPRTTPGGSGDVSCTVKRPSK